MAYSLVKTVEALRLAIPWATVPVAGEPLIGLVDGANRLFRVARPPIVSVESVVDQNGNSVAVSSYDTASGAVVLVSAPTTVCYISYVHSAYTDQYLLACARLGFAKMEEMFPRGYHLVPLGNLLYVSAVPDSVVDPPVGNTTFSASRAQTRFLELCAWVAFLEAAQTEAAANAIYVREERAGGLAIDRTKQPAAWDALRQVALQDLRNAYEAAVLEATGDLSLIYEGGVVPGATSDYYQHAMNWWPSSLQARGLVP